uniref:Uncharacterized protein n=1 Tax=Fervidicoccus fontis TaxID=683846 RepID=A0A7J3ZKA1_9CREN
MALEKVRSNSTTRVNVYFIEGLAMNNMLLEASASECEEGKGLRVVAVDRSGRRLLTPCIDRRAVDKILLTLRLYMQWSRSIVKQDEQT